MADLLEGYRRFRAEVWPVAQARYAALAEGQRPGTMVISCSDSRVDPLTVFGAGPGEMFVVRNIAALVSPHRPDPDPGQATAAALEYAVRVLGVARVVVLGHGGCGGVRAAAEGVPAEAAEFVGPWMATAAEAVRGIASAREREAAVVRLSLWNLATFPWIASAVNAGRLALRGYRFDIGAGLIEEVTADGMRPVV